MSTASDDSKRDPPSDFNVEAGITTSKEDTIIYIGNTRRKLKKPREIHGANSVEKSKGAAKTPDLLRL